ncbi:hypothetical protein [Bradyrhizobium sp. SZCCHNR3003]|uniref:hypothetical protein n=1 Tax=Bradyrhizobium TaxID=374 RepID=UPI002917099F|nr:hypothetical protein [Bradyrhizobium sp. SZCCHNR3003]
MTRLRGRSRFGTAKARASILTRKMDGRVKPGHDSIEMRGDPQMSGSAEEH